MVAQQRATARLAYSSKPRRKIVRFSDQLILQTRRTAHRRRRDRRRDQEERFTRKKHERIPPTLCATACGAPAHKLGIDASSSWQAVLKFHPSSSPISRAQPADAVMRAVPVWLNEKKVDRAAASSSARPCASARAPALLIEHTSRTQPAPSTPRFLRRGRC